MLDADSVGEFGSVKLLTSGGTSLRTRAATVLCLSLEFCVWMSPCMATQRYTKTRKRVHPHIQRVLAFIAHSVGAGLEGPPGSKNP